MEWTVWYRTTPDGIPWSFMTRISSHALAERIAHALQYNQMVVTAWVEQDV